jgi:hypothetical protein
MSSMHYAVAFRSYHPPTPATPAMTVNTSFAKDLAVGAGNTPQFGQYNNQPQWPALRTAPPILTRLQKAVSAFAISLQARLHQPEAPQFSLSA